MTVLVKSKYFNYLPFLHVLCRHDHAIVCRKLKKPCDFEAMIGSLIIPQGPFPFLPPFVLMMVLTSRE